jgi:hypothetical protein
LRTLDAPNNLPAERSSFIGREKETKTIQRLLAEHRLVTLTGIGGSGKTRLALRVGANNLIAFPDGVFFIDLAPITDDGLVAQTTASAGGLLGAARYLGGAADLPIPFCTPASWSLYRHYLPLVRAALGPDEGRRSRDETWVDMRVNARGRRESRRSAPVRWRRWPVPEHA